MIRPLPLKFSLLGIVVLAAVLGALLAAGAPPAGLRITLPALEGDAALIQTPDGRTVLIDGGADGAALATWLGNTLPFGQRRLDAIVLTRADSQTLPGQLAAIKRYSIGAALLPATEKRTSNLDAWWQLLEAQQIMPQTIAAGDRLALGQCDLLALGEHDGNAALALRCPGATALFLQAIDDDLEAELELQQIAAPGIVVYPWGRTTNTTLMRQLTPAAIVFSEGGKADAPQSWDARQVGAARLYHEQLHGQVELLSDERGVTVAAEREEK
jgi:competence protein ComEC